MIRKAPFALVVTLVLFVLTSTSPGQFDSPFKVLPNLSGLSSGPPPEELNISAEIRLLPGSEIGLLQVTATMNRAWHIYSMTTPKGGSQPTEIDLQGSPQFRALGSFAPDYAAEVKFIEVFQVNAEEYSPRVTWSMPIQLLKQSASEAVEIRGTLTGQLCTDAGACLPISADEGKFVAKIGAPLDSGLADGLSGTPIQGIHGRLRTWTSPALVVSGETSLLHVAFEPDPDWHIYAFAPRPPSLFQKPTIFGLASGTNISLGSAVTVGAITSEPSPLKNDPDVRYHNGAVTWSVPLEVAENAKPGSIPVTVAMGLQTCATTCDMPAGLELETTIAVAQRPSSHNQPVPLAPARVRSETSYNAVVALLDDSASRGDELASPSPPAGTVAQTDSSIDALPDTDGSDAAASGSLGFDPAKLQVKTDDRTFASALFWALLGGFALNFMPCVLPVIGLKVMSFVDQAGENRARVLMLNGTYALGMLAIFWVLAIFAAAPALGLSNDSLGWGEQWTNEWFTISLVALVFAMALSFLGVWEIPIPGFATGQKASELASQEGLSGAFFKGSVTTLLATPCSAPGLVTAYGWAVASKSAPAAFMIFTMMGLGMALPYLVIGAFPRLIRLLPKPGAWMDTFKQLMGFLLLGTVVFLLGNVNWINLVPTIGFLFGLWFACWWIGQVPMTAPTEKRLRAWGVSIVIALVSATVAYAGSFDAFGRRLSGLRGSAVYRLESYVANEIQELNEIAQTQVVASTSENELPWERFSLDKLRELTQVNQTVMVDFTADWCQTCKALEVGVLNTNKVRKFVDEHGVKPLIADWSDGDEQIAELMIQLQNSKQIPLLAIFPAGRPNEPILLQAAYTQTQLLKALEKANAGAGQKPNQVATRD